MFGLGIPALANILIFIRKPEVPHDASALWHSGGKWFVVVNQAHGRSNPHVNAIKHAITTRLFPRNCRYISGNLEENTHLFSRWPYVGEFVCLYSISKADA